LGSRWTLGELFCSRDGFSRRSGRGSGCVCFLLIRARMFEGNPRVESRPGKGDLRPSSRGLESFDRLGARFEWQRASVPGGRGGEVGDGSFGHRSSKPFSRFGGGEDAFQVNHSGVGFLERAPGPEGGRLKPPDHPAAGRCRTRESGRALEAGDLFPFAVAAVTPVSIPSFV